MEIEMLVVQGKQRGQTIRFRQGEFVFGRGPECHLRPNSEWVSRQHCLLRVGANTVSIRDLGSTNGTLVNGDRVVGERTLTSGDKLQLGPLVLQIAFSPPPRVSHETQEHSLQTTEFEIPTFPTREVLPKHEVAGDQSDQTHVAT
jgi:pSer/pThr/pTyr-binding forkhead associated (FHA) protein